MIKMAVGLLVLLGIGIIIGVVRKMRGGTFLPPPDMVGGQAEPQSLKDMVERNRLKK
jgi:hypothetical protein